MKIAVCFFGLASGKNDKNDNVDFMKSYDYYNENIIKDNNVDIFMHTWSVDVRETLLSLYNPINCIAEEQIVFDSTINKKHSIKSRFYSSKKSVELKTKYEIENNFKYDLVLLTRYDVSFFNKIDFSQLSNRNFYISEWDDKPGLDSGILDLWFLSNSEKINEFANLFDHIDSYFENIYGKDCIESRISAHQICETHLKNICDENSIKYFLSQNKDWVLNRFDRK